MNAITLALKTAGVKVPPVSERIWRLVKDHPGLSARQVIDKLSLKEASCSSILHQLTARGMLETKSISVMRRIPAGGTAPRRVKTFYVNPRMGGEYELLPLPKKDAKVTQLSVAKRECVAPATPVTCETKTGAPDIDHLTLAQARELYKVLHQLFGERK